MRVSSILKLPKNSNSLEIIKKHLEQDIGYKDYQALISYYCEIGIELDLFEMVYSEATKALLVIAKQQETIYHEKILESIIKAALKLQHYENVESYIDERKELLPVLKQYLAVLDNIKLKKAVGQPYLEDLISILSDVIPEHIKIYCLDEIFQIYLKDKKYEMALESLYKLYEYDYEEKYYCEELEILLALKNYDKVLKKALQNLKEKKENPRVILVLLKVYMINKSYKKASTLEAKYENLIDLQEPTYKAEIYQLIIKLYQELGNKPSLVLYERRLKNIKSTLVKVMPDKEPSLKEIAVKSERKESKAKHTNLLRHLEICHKLVKLSHEIDYSFNLRDFLRTFFMSIDNDIKVKSYVVYLKDSTPNLYRYKKQRVYDKTIIDYLRSETVVDAVLSSRKEFFGATSKIKWTKDITTQKGYEKDIKFIYCFPLGDKGVFAVYLEQDIKDPGDYYDLFKLISVILTNHLIDEKKVKRIKTENRFLNNIIDSPVIALRELDEHSSTYNTQAQELFNIDKHYHQELFLKEVSYESVNKYQQTIKTLLSKPGEQKEIFYQFQEKYISEKLYSLKKGNDIKIISIFTDQTKEVAKTKNLIKTATIDFETGVSNEYALALELNENLKDKASLFLIELDQKLKHIYGNEKTSLYFKEFVQHSKKFFDDGKVYRFDFNQIFVVVPYNDIRSVTKKIKSYLKYLNDYESKVLKYERFKINMGVLRYPVVTVEKQKDKIFRYLEIALDKAKRTKGHKYEFFVYRDYEDELFEQQVIDHLNVAIENKNLGLVFNQITDVSKNIVWQYESELVLFNLLVESKYLLTIAKKRNRILDLERYLLTKVCEFLVKLEKTTQRLIKLTIPLSKETFLDPQFNSFVMGLFKKHEIPCEFIRLKFDMNLRASHYANQIQELLDHGFSLDTTSLDMALSYPFNALHINLGKENIKFNSYLSKINELLNNFQMAIIVRGVKTKSQKEMLKQLGINYLQGPFYKQIPAPALIKKIKESL